MNRLSTSIIQDEKEGVEIPSREFFSIVKKGIVLDFLRIGVKLSGRG
jgi:hypothetical protein